MKSLVLGFIIFLLAFSQVSAAADYVLPYPGLMPGHRLYTFKQVFDQLRYFWAFGNFSRHKYELELADKKLVEAKVLFEYQQYFLATKALKASSDHFQKSAVFLEKAATERKDISAKMAILKAAAEKHQEVLRKLQTFLPEEFLWQPEKKVGVELNLKSNLEEAIKKREL
jgi:hypothetical protein